MKKALVISLLAVILSYLSFMGFNKWKDNNRVNRIVEIMDKRAEEKKLLYQTLNDKNFDYFYGELITCTDVEAGCFIFNLSENLEEYLLNLISNKQYQDVVELLSYKDSNQLGLGIKLTLAVIRTGNEELIDFIYDYITKQIKMVRSGEISINKTLEHTFYDGEFHPQGYSLMNLMSRDIIFEAIELGNISILIKTELFLKNYGYPYAMSYRERVDYDYKVLDRAIISDNVDVFKYVTSKIMLDFNNEYHESVVLRVLWHYPNTSNLLNYVSDEVTWNMSSFKEHVLQRIMRSLRYKKGAFEKIKGMGLLELLDKHYDKGSDRENKSNRLGFSGTDTLNYQAMMTFASLGEHVLFEKYIKLYTKEELYEMSITTVDNGSEIFNLSPFYIFAESFDVKGVDIMFNYGFNLQQVKRIKDIFDSAVESRQYEFALKIFTNANFFICESSYTKLSSKSEVSNGNAYLLRKAISESKHNRLMPSC